MQEELSALLKIYDIIVEFIIRSVINRTHAALKQAGVNIPFPQREVRML